MEYPPQNSSGVVNPPTPKKHHFFLSLIVGTLALFAIALTVWAVMCAIKKDKCADGKTCIFGQCMGNPKDNSCVLPTNYQSWPDTAMKTQSGKTDSCHNQEFEGDQVHNLCEALALCDTWDDCQLVTETGDSTKPYMYGPAHNYSPKCSLDYRQGKNLVSRKGWTVHTKNPSK